MPENICAKCIDDRDLTEWIVDYDGEPGCDFCGQSDAPTIPFSELVEFMRERINTFYSNANEHLMYISAEGGFQGTTYDTWDMLFDQLQLDLPRDEGDKLRDALLDAIGDEVVWCEYDPARLDDNESMLMDWGRFCVVVKHDRRFFFHKRGERRDFMDDTLSPSELLKAIAVG